MKKRATWTKSDKEELFRLSEDSRPGYWADVFQVGDKWQAWVGWGGVQKGLLILNKYRTARGAKKAALDGINSLKNGLLYNPLTK